MDIVERLRSAAWAGPIPSPVCDEAADEIARLRAQAQHESDCVEAYKTEIERLRDENAKLQKIADAAQNLIAQKGRHNTEIAYRRLADALAERKGGVMDDRKLLEMAARAAGIELLDFYGERYAARIIATNKLIGWNPLADDGDALRLAVNLKFNLFLDYQSGVDAVMGTGVLTGQQLPPEHWHAHGNDPYAATRRAIVRAAAAIAQETTDAKG